MNSRELPIAHRHWAQPQVHSRELPLPQLYSRELPLAHRHWDWARGHMPTSFEVCLQQWLGNVEDRTREPPRVLSIVAHVGVGVVLLVLVAVALWRTEATFLMRLRRLRSGGGAEEHEKRKQE